MPYLARLLRLMVVVAFATGLALPAQAHGYADGPSAQHLMPGHQMQHMALSVGVAAKPGAMDETCRQHCLGLSVLTGAVVPTVVRGRVNRVAVIAPPPGGPAFLPPPEGHPPRL